MQLKTSPHSPAAAGHEDLETSPWKAEIRLLFTVAACVFTVTMLIGLLNGQTFVTLSRNVLFTHVHAGTLGWITLGMFAVSLWLFGSRQPSARESQYMHWTSVLAAVAIPVYTAAFFTGNFLARAIFGFPVLLAIVALLGWVVWRAMRTPLGIPQLAVLGALITLTIGGILGVLLQVGFASGKQFLPGGAFTAHPSALVSDYLILVGMGVSEWRLHSTRSNDFRLGSPSSPASSPRARWLPSPSSPMLYHYWDSLHCCRTLAPSSPSCASPAGPSAPAGRLAPASAFSSPAGSSSSCISPSPSC